MVTKLDFEKTVQVAGSQALKIKNPSPFNIARKKQAIVAEVLGSNPLNVSFRRSLDALLEISASMTNIFRH